MIDTIFIMLGSACNLNCKYCMQHDIREAQVESKDSSKVVRFILDRAEEQETPIDVRFYGGEPLLYFETIKDIISKLGNKVQYSIITNGKLLDREKVDFFNRIEMHVGVSWDGIVSKDTRGYNVIKENVEMVLRIKRLSISGVLSGLVYPKELFASLNIINNEYFNIYGYSIGFAIEELLDFGGTTEDLTKIDFDRVRKDMEFACDMVYNNSNKLSLDIRVQMAHRTMMEIKQAEEYNFINPERMKCSNGYNVLNVDLDGNMYNCHNTRTIVGNVEGDCEEYIKNVEAIDATRTNYPKCKDCSIYSFCQCGCPLVKDDARETFYCDLKRAIYEPIYALKKKIDEDMANVPEPLDTQSMIEQADKK